MVSKKILEEQKGNSAFKFIESSTGKFAKLVSYDGFIYRLNDDLTFKIKNFSNKKLIEYIKTIDFRIIILQKISLIGIDRLDRINKLSSLFSDKEKKLLM